MIISKNCCHSPCGSVDWNNIRCYRCRTRRSLPLRECGLKCASDSISGIVIASLPLRECGLKCHHSGMYESRIFRHSPCGSVDWNSGRLFMQSRPAGSLPLRECGLKYPESGQILHRPRSLPLRECGLKSMSFSSPFGSSRHSPCGSVDWNLMLLLKSHFPHCHSPCGSVDWNHLCADIIVVPETVTPLAGVWIEIVKLVEDFTNDSSSLPLRECGLKLVSAHMGARTGGHSPCGSVDWNEPEVQKVLQKWVTPLAGVWIEIYKEIRYLLPDPGHSPCGSVDWNMQR